MSDEYLRIFKVLWTESPASFAAASTASTPCAACHGPCSGRTRRSGSAVIARPPFAAPRASATAGIPVGANPAVPLPPAELSALLGELRRLTERRGARSVGDRRLLQGAGVRRRRAPTATAPGRLPFTGSADAIASDIAAFARLGVSEIVFDFRSERLDESLERMERFAPVIRQTAGA